MDVRDVGGFSDRTFETFGLPAWAPAPVQANTETLKLHFYVTLLYLLKAAY